jgi:hypothetical protein
MHRSFVGFSSPDVSSELTVPPFAAAMGQVRAIDHRKEIIELCRRNVQRLLMTPSRERRFLKYGYYGLYFSSSSVGLLLPVLL